MSQDEVQRKTGLSDDQVDILFDILEWPNTEVIDVAVGGVKIEIGGVHGTKIGGWFWWLGDLYQDCLDCPDCDVKMDMPLIQLEKGDLGTVQIPLNEILHVTLCPECGKPGLRVGRI